MNVDGALVDIDVTAPDAVEQLLAAENPAGVLEKKLQQPILGRAKIDRTAGGLRLRIVDDGRGFEAATVPDGHLGLAGMRARAEKIGAFLDVTSKPGAGTTIEVIVPETVVATARAARPADESLSSAE